MKTENKSFFDQGIFVSRVIEAMSIRGIGYEQLWEILNNKVGYTITLNNLKIYINQRIPNIQFALALSKALGVSLDYIFGNDDEERELIKGISHHLDSKKYQKYIGKYNLYFYNTVSNEPKHIIKASFEIKYTTKYEVIMIIDTTEGDKKIYKGKIMISNTSQNVFVMLHADFGEEVSLCMYEVPTIFSKFRCAVGAMLSISSGDLKRSPVMNRFVLTDYEVTEDKMKYVQAHLRLNTKYININPSKLENTIKKIISDEETANEILDRIKNAFSVREYYAVEESYVTNTLRRDFDLSDIEAEEIIAELRIQSLANINSKINRSLDSKIFECTCEDNMV